MFRALILPLLVFVLSAHAADLLRTSTETHIFVFEADFVGKRYAQPHQFSTAESVQETQSSDDLVHPWTLCQSRREQSDRREQLLTWLDDYCGESAANLENERTLIDEALTDFNRRLSNGGMPELAYININSSYDSTFSLSFFQAGAGELLDVGTLRQLRCRC